MGKNKKIIRLKVRTSEAAGEVTSNIFGALIDEKIMPTDQKLAEKLLNIIAAEIDKWIENITNGNEDDDVRH